MTDRFVSNVRTKMFDSRDEKKTAHDRFNNNTNSLVAQQEKK